MKRNTLNKLAALLLAAVLTLSVLTGCGAASSSAAASAGAASTGAAASSTVTITATLKITDPEGSVTELPLTCSEGDTLAAALLAAGVISQEEADAGFVTVVNGVEANWDKDQAWWGLVDANGEMTAVGISDITLADGDVYGFVYNVG